MLTYEDVTAFFLGAAASLGLVTHPEYWTNGRSMEREFDCVCHFGSCEGSETRSSCTLSFTWSALDTASYWSVGFASARAGWMVGPRGRIAKIQVR